MKTILSVIVPSLNGEVPRSLEAQVAGHPEVEIVSVVGVRPVGKARNEGLARAKGAYIAWVDADDEVVGGEVEKVGSGEVGSGGVGSRKWLDAILEAIKSGPDIVTFDTRIEWHDGSGRATYGQAHRTDDFARDYLRGRLPGQLWCKVFRAELFAGKRFAGACYEDSRMINAIIRESRAKGVKLRVIDIPEPLYIYKRRATGLSQHMSMGPAFWSALAMTCEARSLDELVGIAGLWWDLVKTPIRRIVRRQKKGVKQ